MKVNTDGCLLGAAMTLLPSDRRFLDVGTGTGLIAMMAAQRLSPLPVEISAIDIDKASAEEASGNFAASPWPGCLRCENVSLDDFRCDGPFDLVFSNPPYFENSLRNPDLRDASARHADSLSWRDILEFAKRTGSSRVSLVLPATEELPLRREAAALGYLLFRIVRVRTTPAKPVSRIIAEFSTANCGEPKEMWLSIHAKEGGYSFEYTSLLGDFLLFC